MKRTFVALLIAVFAVVGLAACGEVKESKAIANGEKKINSQLEVLEKAEPVPLMRDSADRAVQANWYTEEADPNKIWYVEQLSYTGSVVASFTTRGPVEPASDEVTNPSQISCKHFAHQDGEGGCEPGVIGLAEPNGVYQHPGNEHIARLSDGAMYRFEGSYAQSDQPFEVKTPESIAINGSAPISHTNLETSVGGKQPPRG